MDDVLTDYYAGRIDFRWNRKTKTYSVVRLNTDPSLVLYMDGRCRKTTDSEIQKQLADYLT